MNNFVLIKFLKNGIQSVQQEEVPKIRFYRAMH